MTPDPKPTEALKLAFSVDIAHWPEGRCVIYSHSESMACSYACQSAKEAGYNVDRSEFSAKRSPEYDRFASELKWNWGYDFEYLQGRLFSRLDELERNTTDRDAELAAMRSAMELIQSRCNQLGCVTGELWRIAQKALASTAGTELLERLRKAEEERDEITKLLPFVDSEGPGAYKRWVDLMDELSRTKSLLVTAQSESAGLRKAILDAPHSETCLTRSVEALSHRCDCWRASALKNKS